MSRCEFQAFCNMKKWIFGGILEKANFSLEKKFKIHKKIAFFFPKRKESMRTYYTCFVLTELGS